jgi:hypothetical protein
LEPATSKMIAVPPWLRDVMADVQPGPTPGV